MELLVFSLFAAALLVCVIFHISLLFALLLGYVIFALYAIRKGFSLPEVLGMSAQGVRAAKNILTTFVLIGILTSLWRAGGTIPAIVCYSVRVMEPRLFLVCSFLLNCLVSFLTGTAFGSAATMGAVCMTMAAALGAGLENLLSGELEANQTTGGTMKHLTFFVCPQCGNLLTASGEAAVTCCGKTLSPLDPVKSGEEDRLEVELIENDYFISSPHPMTKEHYVSFVALVTGDALVLRRLYPEWDLQTRLPRLGHGKLLWYCVRHGLFYQLV